MAAIKNVGEGPVEAILAARNEGGPFTSLEDFCDRVDLRKVGKRPLEFLIKAGALDRFGNRCATAGRARPDGGAVHLRARRPRCRAAVDV